MASDTGLKDTLSGQASLLAELAMMSIQPTLKDQAITMSMFDLLGGVRTCGKKATQAEIARRLGISPVSLSETIAAALKKGLVEQTPSARDGRVKLLRLTSEGALKLNRVLAAVNQMEQKMVKGIEQEELRKAVLVLETAGKNLAKDLMSR